MGYDINRFKNGHITNNIGKELICKICFDVFEQPVETTNCRHIFCRSCILPWVRRHKNCPYDRSFLSPWMLAPPSPLLISLMERLLISCEFENEGCRSKLALDNIVKHEQDCDFNPINFGRCKKANCDFTHTKHEVQIHEKYNCARDIRTDVDKIVKVLNENIASMKQLQESNNEMSENIGNLEQEIADIKKEMIRIHDYLNVSNVTNGVVSTVDKDINTDIISWSQTLSKIYIESVSGIIETPNDFDKILLETALKASGCPSHILNELIKNSVKKNWPSNVLINKQKDGHLCGEYIYRKIPSSQAIVILKSDNPILGKNINVGFTMIFNTI